MREPNRDCSSLVNSLVPAGNQRVARTTTMFVPDRELRGLNASVGTTWGRLKSRSENACARRSISPTQVNASGQIHSVCLTDAG